MRFTSTALAVVTLALVVFTSAATADEAYKPRDFKVSGGATPSGAVEFREQDFGTGITECPQARLKKLFNEPLDRRVRDAVEQYSDNGNDLRTNEEYTCFPQNETSVDTNPANGHQNVVTGQNDYRLGTASSGFGASNDGGQTWYGGIIPFPSSPATAGNQGFLVSGGDPAIVFDRSGVVYYAMLGFNRNNDDNGIFVARSTNGGFTWSRACVAQGTEEAGTFCGGAGDVRQPGDGTVVYQTDNDAAPNFSVDFHDKEYIAAGPRPAGVEPVCFTPITHAPRACNPAQVGVDRLHVTWTAFNAFTFDPCPFPGFPPTCTFTVSSTIEHSYSDDQGRSWSPHKTINGSASFCNFAFAGGNECDDNQFSVPTVNPQTGLLGVAFENFNTQDENQILFVRSSDGGNTFQGPFFVTPMFDTNYPRAGAAGGRPDCTNRGQQSGRMVLTNSCFRTPSTLAVVAERRGGDFANDFHLVMFDNRNGTRVSTNTDVFYFKSIDGGSSWIGPTRVNNDASATPANFACPFTGATACPTDVHTGNDQWWPWVDINNQGHLNVAFSDRRLDTSSTAHEYPTSRSRTGNYVVWYWGAQCTVRTPALRECVAPGAQIVPQPTGGINPSGSDPQPGQGPTFLGRFANFGISDTPSNWDYGFRGGIFLGDYNAVAVTENDSKAYGFWTDARNGRSSRNPVQPGRNPICEQSDVMIQQYSSTPSTPGQQTSRAEDRMFDVTPCPADAPQP